MDEKNKDLIVVEVTVNFVCNCKERTCIFKIYNHIEKAQKTIRITKPCWCPYTSQPINPTFTDITIETFSE